MEEYATGMERIKHDIEWEELTMAIYRLGRIVVEKMLPEELVNFPEFAYSREQEHELLILLAKLQFEEKTEFEYQAI